MNSNSGNKKQKKQESPDSANQIQNYGSPNLSWKNTVWCLASKGFLPFTFAISLTIPILEIFCRGRGTRPLKIHAEMGRFVESLPCWTLSRNNSRTILRRIVVVHWQCQTYLCRNSWIESKKIHMKSHAATWPFTSCKSSSRTIYGTITALPTKTITGKGLELI